MRHRRRLAALASAALLGVSVVSQSAGASITVVADGLLSPRDVEVAANGRILLSEAGAGRVWSIDRKGNATVILEDLPTLTSPEGEATGPHGLAASGNGNAIVLIGEGTNTPDEDARWQTLVRVKPAGKQVADIGAYQATDPDPTDLDEPAYPTQSNPYGLALLDDGKALVTDAGNNDLLLVSPNGRIQTVARFPASLQTTAHLPPFIGIPPNIQIPGEAVPTSVAVGPDGAWYVGQLNGFPFQPGASTVYRIDPSARGAVCSPTASSGGCSVWATGFTSVVAIDFGPDGDLYVVEMVESGVLNFFIFGDDEGALIRVDWATKAKTEIADGELTTPGGVAVAGDGTIYVSTGSVSTDGQLLRIRP